MVLNFFLELGVAHVCAEARFTLTFGAVISPTFSPFRFVFFAVGFVLDFVF